ncbi:MAG: glycine cleavage system aminomethyltransferase GcvT [Synergistaceae bacterium]
MDLKTPLYDSHVKANGKIVPFAGYLLPVQYATGIISEHMAVRTNVGIFDVSHMAEFTLVGNDAMATVQKVVTNDCSDMTSGQVKYTCMCYENGNVIDDLLVYKEDDTHILLVLNASNRHKDAEWISKQVVGDTKFEDISDSVGQIALQGPNSLEVLKKLTDETLLPTKYYTFIKNCVVAGKTCLVSRTGYTGEFGYEIYCNSEDTVEIWDALLEAGKDLNIIPCGLGSRDTLRFEAGMPLYGHEMDENTNPYEAGLGFCVKLAKEDFLGKAALEAAKPPKRKCVTLKVTGKGVVREHQDVYVGDEKIGVTASGTFCPFLKAPYATAIIKAEFIEIGAIVEVDVRGRRVEAEIVKGPIYDRPKQ